jgi:hypothetical protein
MSQPRKNRFDEGFTAGAEFERKRIQRVEEQALPGHEDLIATLKYDGHTTGEQAAVQVIAERKKLLATADQDEKKPTALFIAFRNTGRKA